VRELLSLNPPGVQNFIILCETRIGVVGFSHRIDPDFLRVLAGIPTLARGVNWVNHAASCFRVNSASRPGFETSIFRHARSYLLAVLFMSGQPFLRYFSPRSRFSPPLEVLLRPRPNFPSLPLPNFSHAVSSLFLSIGFSSHALDLRMGFRLPSSLICKYLSLSLRFFFQAVFSEARRRLFRIFSICPPKIDISPLPIPLPSPPPLYPQFLGSYTPLFISWTRHAFYPPHSSFFVKQGDSFALH